MVTAAPSFLTLPERSAKPRRTGITHVLDKGMPVSEAAALLAVSGPYVDVWKLGWGTAYLDPGLAPKLTLLAEHEVLACTGGTLLEIAWHQGAVDACLDWAAEVGFPCVEVSSGVVQLTEAERSALITRAAQRFTVLSEVGLKDPAVAVSGQQWAKEAAAALAAGARWIVTEGRESGTVGLYDPDGRVREQVVDDVVAAVGAENVVFEAPRKDQQSWLVRRFGPDVSLGNIAPGEVLPLEALRLGLRADTFDPTRAPGGGHP
jgi:phosphosulfolactate synthase